MSYDDLSHEEKGALFSQALIAWGEKRRKEQGFDEVVTKFKSPEELTRTSVNGQIQSGGRV